MARLLLLLPTTNRNANPNIPTHTCAMADLRCGRSSPWPAVTETLSTAAAAAVPTATTTTTTTTTNTTQSKQHRSVTVVTQYILWAEWNAVGFATSRHDNRRANRRQHRRLSASQQPAVNHLCQKDLQLWRYLDHRPVLQ